MGSPAWQHPPVSLEDHIPDGFEIPDEPSDRASFWGAFWEAGVSPWDLGGHHPELARLFPAREGGRVIVPGCGRAHDAVYLAEVGFDVLAIDIHGGLEAEVSAHLAASGGRFVVADALAFEDESGFDLWWDHTFFCAIPPARRGDWGAAAARLVRPGGRLAALVFPVGKPPEDGGPPFGLATEDVVRALGPVFDLESEAAALTAGERRPGAERVAVFRRR